MVYFSNKEKITKYIETCIIPALKTRDLDFKKVINAITKETLCTENMATELLSKFIPGNIEEIHILTIPPNKIVDLLKEERTEQQKIEDILNAK